MSKPSLYEVCQSPELAHLLTEWDAERNSPLTPDNISSGARNKVWWTCEHGHSWQASVYSRVALKSNCPYCSGNLPITGKTDLATKFPEIAAEWHPTRNGDLTPDKVAAHGQKKVWWICPKGHEYEMVIYYRTTGGSNCPICSGQRVVSGFNDLASHYPEIAAEWHPTLNGDLTPDRVTAHSGKKVWWLCPEGHAYLSAISKRTRERSSSCPYCLGRKVLPGFNDLATKFPEVAKQWHPTLNGDVTPDQILPGTAKKFWWVCDEGHIWQAACCNRTHPTGPTGCPVCAGKNGSPYAAKAAEALRQLEIEQKIKDKSK